MRYGLKWSHVSLLSRFPERLKTYNTGSEVCVEFDLEVRRTSPLQFRRITNQSFAHLCSKRES